MEPSFDNAATQVGISKAVPFFDFTKKRFGEHERFEFQSFFKAGGMGEIWIGAVHERRQSRRVAIKIILQDVQSITTQNLFLREREMHDRVRDVPGVVTLIDTGNFPHPITNRPVFYFVMEWVDQARTLTQACADLPIDGRIDLCRRVCETLAIIHHRAIVHCDLKPQNIIVDKDNRPFIIDFGLAISKRPEDIVHSGTEIGKLRGTFTYMAPEQYKSDCDPFSYTPALDVYAMGIVVYQCITGMLPYAKDPGSCNDRNQAAAVVEGGAIIRSRTGNRTLPFSLVRTLRRAVSTIPTDRFEDAGAFAAELKNVTRRSAAREWALGAGSVGLVIALMVMLIGPVLDSRWIYTSWYKLIYKLAENRVDLSPLRIIELDEATLPNQLGLRQDSLKRALLAAFLERLATTDCRAVAIDAWFPALTAESEQPAAPNEQLSEPSGTHREEIADGEKSQQLAANQAFTKAVEKFEKTHKGTVIFGTEDWCNSDTPALDPKLDSLRGHQFALKANIFDSIEQVAIETGIRYGLGGSQIGFAPAAAGATLNPGTRICGELSESGDVIVAFADRMTDQPVAKSLIFRSAMERFEAPEKKFGATEQDTAALSSHDQIGKVVTVRLPRNDQFKAVTIPAQSLLDDPAGGKIKSELRNRLAILTWKDQPNEEQTDKHQIGDRKVPGVWIQATAIAALITTATSTGVAALTSVNSLAWYNVWLLMPCAVLIGVVTGRRKVVRGTRIGMLLLTTLLLLGASCLAAALTYKYLYLLWNPSTVAVSYFVGAFVATMLPWMKLRPTNAGRKAGATG